MPPVLVAIIAILIGLIGCFYGYPLFRAYLILLGLVIGYVLGLNFVPADQWFLALVVGIIAAVVLAALAYPLWSIGILLIGAILGFALFAALGTTLGFDQTGVVLLGVVGAILLGFLFFGARDVMAMVITAFNGAALVIFGLGLLLIPALRFGPIPVDLAETVTGTLPTAAQSNPVALISIIVLGALGFAVQYRMFRGRRLYA